MDNFIKIRGAREHNLKNIDIDIPKNKLVVFTGVSGSGKSSLAFDTIYAEGQRRYVESLSTYARQFLGILEKPDIDSIEGLSPAISIEQKTTSKNPRSTVGTTTEIYDYLRLLFARIGHPSCPICGREISRQSIDLISEKMIELIENNIKTNKKMWFFILSPVVREKKGEYSSLFDNLKSKGYRQVRIDGYIKYLNEDFILIKTNKHNIDVVVDKISLTLSDLKNKIFFENLKTRIVDSIQQALDLSGGTVIFSEIKDKGFEIPEYPKIFSDNLFSEMFSCPFDNIEIPEIEPRIFSFNSPLGACENCTGLGKILKIDKYLILSESLSILEGGILPFSNIFEHDTWYSRLIKRVCDENNINIKAPISKLSESDLNIILFGTGERQYVVNGLNRWGRETVIREVFRGVINEVEKRYKESTSEWLKNEYEKYMREKTCELCMGKRLKKESLFVKIDGKSISDISDYSVGEGILWINNIKNGNKLTSREREISKPILAEIEKRLLFLNSVGLEYLTLNRESGSLSGGEAQRIRLASQIGSGLTGVLYILDEPTIGLHQKDNKKLIDTLKKLRDLGNTVIVVEHDKEMIENADYILDFGPGAGFGGGEIIACGILSEIILNERSITGKYISRKRFIGNKIDMKNINKADNYQIFQNYANNKYLNNKEHKLTLYGCNKYNLKNIDVSFPLGKFICITGVSGSGKSTLLTETLYPALLNKINKYFKYDAENYKNIEGFEYIDKVILIDQSPIGRTPRSNPATYVGMFDEIRELLATTKDAKSLGYKKGRFSFNLKGGRCEVCEGQGQIKIEMQFMSDLWITCDVCKGKRYNASTLDVLYNGRNISEILEMSILEAKDFFSHNPKILTKIDTLLDVGLGYMKIGQPATTLSGGEAQRVKLASELSRKATGKTLYILDEPTTGLHFVDVEKLLKVLRMLVNRGNTVIIIEHNLDVIKNSDYIIDLGPDGGDKGGYIVSKGTVEEVKSNNSSYTGQCLIAYEKK